MKLGKANRSKFSGACLIAVGVTVVAGAYYTALAVQAGEPLKVAGYIALAVVISLYYLALFFWSEGNKFFDNEA